jgi:hypothetical protein
VNTAQFVRCAVVCLCTLTLAAAQALAGEDGGAGTRPAPEATAKPATAKSNRPATSEELFAAIEQLRGLVESQNQQIQQQQMDLREQARKLEALHHRLEQVIAGRPEAPAAEPGIAVAATAAVGTAAGPPQETNAGTAQRATEAKLRQLGNFAFSGDVRFRYEPFFGGGVASSPAPDSRHRPRIRLRFNVNARFSPEWNGGFSVASGDDADPISSNQTLTTFFTRKAFRIDRAFIEYTPNWMKTALRNHGEFKLTAGKFGYTWYRTEMTLDNDLNVEGVSQTLAFNFQNPMFKKLTFVAFQLPFNEVSAGPDSFMHGGQIQTQWQFGSRMRFGGYMGFYEWNHADAIRAAQSAGTLGGSTNRNAATTTQFASKFGILDVIGRFDFTTWSSRWPLMVQFNYASNTRACANLANITGTPPACDASDRHAQLGQNREARDLQFGYTFLRIEREAVLGAFNFSDLRAPSNVLTHRLNIGYQANRNVNFTFTSLFGRQLTTASSAEERILKRLQLDLVYKF